MGGLDGLPQVEGRRSQIPPVFPVYFFQQAVFFHVSAVAFWEFYGSKGDLDPFTRACLNTGMVTWNS